MISLYFLPELRYDIRKRSVISVTEMHKKYYEKRGAILVKNLKSRHFDAYYCNTKAEALDKALELGADTFQFFTRNPRGSKAKELDPADAAVLVELMRVQLMEN